jgi:hypothetical protein
MFYTGTKSFCFSNIFNLQLVGFEDEKPIDMEDPQQFLSLSLSETVSAS